MARTLCKEIVLDGYAVGTMDVMDYADEHPDEYFDHTNVRSKNHNYDRLMVSEYLPDHWEEKLDELNPERWHNLPNGWQREGATPGVWVCRKNGRYIIITN